MDFERNQRRFESVYSNKVKAGKRRTYFFDVRKTKGSDYYLTITESKRRFEGEGYERHKIFLYKEDFNRFMEGLQDAVDHVKNDLMPDYDYDEYTRRHQQYEEERANGTFEEKKPTAQNSENESENESKTESKDFEYKVEEDDLSW